MTLLAEEPVMKVKSSSLKQVQWDNEHCEKHHFCFCRCLVLPNDTSLLNFSYTSWLSVMMNGERQGT